MVAGACVDAKLEESRPARGLLSCGLQGAPDSPKIWHAQASPNVITSAHKRGGGGRRAAASARKRGRALHDRRRPPATEPGESTSADMQPHSPARLHAALGSSVWAHSARDPACLVKSPPKESASERCPPTSRALHAASSLSSLITAAPSLITGQPITHSRRRRAAQRQRVVQPAGHPQNLLLNIRHQLR